MARGGKFTRGRSSFRGGGGQRHVVQPPRNVSLPTAPRPRAVVPPRATPVQAPIQRLPNQIPSRPPRRALPDASVSVTRAVNNQRPVPIASNTQRAQRVNTIPPTNGTQPLQRYSPGEEKKSNSGTSQQESQGRRFVQPDDPKEDWTSRFVSYFINTASGRQSVKEVLRNGQNCERHANASEVHSCAEINCQDLAEWDPDACVKILKDPESMLPLLNTALVEAQEQYLRSGVCNDSWIPIVRAHARLYHLPPLSLFEKKNVSAIRSKDVGHLVQITGSIVRSGSTRMLEVARIFECGKCSQRFRVPSDRLENYAAKKPRRCLASVGCDSKRFTEFDVENTDYQELVLQEHSDTLSIGTVPRSIVVCCEDDLVDTATAGDTVVVVGQILVRWQPVHSEVRVDADMVLLANSIRTPGSSRHLLGALLSAEDRKHFTDFWQAQHRTLAARDTFIYSVCPDIYGRSIIKLALLLTLVGGISSEDADSKQTFLQQDKTDDNLQAPKSWQRGTPHLLLIGDPGTGKSQFLRFAELVAPRSVLTTGTGTSSAGLTCAAVKGPDGQWILEAGALPLADRGCCLIDEFGQMKAADRAVIHEAMEQQSISFAKAGLVGKLPTRCAVVAACNPKQGTYDRHADLSTNTGLPPPLLSRFDVVLIIHDEKHQDWDRLAATAILQDQLAPDEPRLTADSDDDHLEVLSTDDLQREALTECNIDFSTASFVNAHLEAHKENTLGQPSSLDKIKEQRFVIRPKRKLDKTSDDSKSITHTRKKQKASLCSDQLWSLAELRKYIVHVKQNFCPVITDDAGALLSTYYTHQRSRIGAASGRATVRMLESLIRLTQAHARIMSRHHACIQDAVIACILVDKSMGPKAAFDATLDVIPEPHETTSSDTYFHYQRASVFSTLNFDPGRHFSRPPSNGALSDFN